MIIQRNSLKMQYGKKVIGFCLNCNTSLIFTHCMIILFHIVKLWFIYSRYMYLSATSASSRNYHTHHTFDGLWWPTSHFNLLSFIVMLIKPRRESNSNLVLTKSNLLKLQIWLRTKWKTSIGNIFKHLRIQSGVIISIKNIPFKKKRENKSDWWVLSLFHKIQQIYNIEKSN